MLRASLSASLTVLLVAVTGVFAQPQGTPQVAPPVTQQPPDDRTPNDPAAIGFLANVVDQKLYSLEAAGAAKLVTTVHAAWEGRADSPPPFDFEITCDYSNGTVTTRPLANPPESLKPLVGSLYAFGQAIVALLPSRDAGVYVITHALDGELVRLDYKSRNANAPENSFQEWFRKDGTKARRKIEMKRLDGGLKSYDVVCEYTEADGRLLLKSQKPSDPKVRFAMEFEYERLDGFRVLKRQVVTSDDVRLVMDFKTKIEAAPR